MTERVLENKSILIIGGTGSLGKVLLRRLLGGEAGSPARIIVLSRDESKQYALRAEYERKASATHDILYENFRSLLEFRIGDVRDIHSLVPALRSADIVFNAAALKQVPTCEYFPFEAVRTNIEGAENVVRAIRDFSLSVETVVGISTDKAASPVNVMGMTKALQERILARANLDIPSTRFVMVRYGNVLASRGSVVPLFHDQILSGGPVTVTHPEMTRFLLSLDDAVDTILAAARLARRGEIFVPRIRSARIQDIANALIGKRSLQVRITGIRPGEKLHEVLVTDEERGRTRTLDAYYVIMPLLPELRSPPPESFQGLSEEFSSRTNLMGFDEAKAILERHGLLVEQRQAAWEETLR